QQRLDRRNLVHDAGLRAPVRDDPGAAPGMAEQFELQPGHLRSGSMDGESNDRERRVAPRSPEREHRTVYGGTLPLAAEPSGPTGCRRERPELERYQSAGVGRLGPVWKRQDSAEGEREPRWRTRPDP